MQIKFDHVSFSYNPNTPFQVDALKDINLEFFENNVTAIVGRTGSGKSTLTELINKLLTPTSGRVVVNNLVNDKKVKVKGKKMKAFRKDIGFLFQFSEHQLFEDSVIKDVMFGIKSYYPKHPNPLALAKQSLSLVGLDETFYERSPFDLSGGEKKRVAIAGVLAYQPKVLILDEPTAGLDNKGKKEIMDLFMKIHQTGVAIILVSHDMDVVLEYADQMVVIDNGEIERIGKPKEILKEDVEQYNLETPNIYKVVHLLKRHGKKIDENKITDIASLIKELKNNG
ncbi:MAG: ATP-binding cassette domain-containing protein [Bacilli bacterium]|nr:ATP-binding cassette domain-containing protein [Bacilli bacterium]